MTENHESNLNDEINLNEQTNGNEESNMNQQSNENGESNMNEEIKVEREFHEKLEPFEVKVEGLEDGYRFTVRGDMDKIKKQRNVGTGFIQFAKQAEKAGWPLPWIVRVLIKFWGKYKTPQA